MHDLLYMQPNLLQIMKIFTVEYMKNWSYTAKWVPNWFRLLGSNDNFCIGPPTVVVDPSKCAEFYPLGTPKSKYFFYFLRKKVIHEKRKGGRRRPPVGIPRVNQLTCLLIYLVCYVDAHCYTETDKHN